MGIVKSFSRISREQILKMEGVISKERISLILENISENFDVDKAWELIHFMITGEKAFFGKHEFSMFLSPSNSTIQITDEEYDFYWEENGNGNKQVIERWKQIEIKVNSSIDYLDTKNIEKLIIIIEQNNIEDLISNINFSKLNVMEIYPENWEDSEEHKDYVKYHYQKLYEFLLTFFYTN